MIDGGLRDKFRDKLRRGWHWQSIETGGTGRGIPDSNFCTDGIEGWIEFKKTEAWSVGLRTEQIGWIRERTIRGGRVFVATRRQTQGGVRLGAPVDEIWLHSGRVVSELGKHGLKGPDPLIVCSGGPENWDWDKIGEILCR